MNAARRSARSWRGGALIAFVLAVGALAPISGAQAEPAATPAAAAATPSTPTTPHRARGAQARAGVAQHLRGDRSQRACQTASPGHASCAAIVDTDVSGPLATTSAAGPSGYWPTDLQSAYGLNSAGGTGKTVGIVTAYDSPTAATDLATYRSEFGLPVCGSGCFTKIDQTGGTSYPAANASWAVETSLDLAMVSASCPNCKILLVEARSSSISDLAHGVAMAASLGADAISNSYGTAEFAQETSYDSYYRQPGVTVTVSSGDSGYGAQYPAASPYVTAVGGTKLTSTSGSWSESAWSGAGSGCSAYEAKPTWQSDTGCTRRTIADLSVVADPSTGVAFYDSTPDSNGLSGWRVAGGTSVGAPFVAGASALGSDQSATGYPVQQAYSASSGLRDVVSGTNGSCSPTYLCTAQGGYDGPTGLGSPIGTTALAPSATSAAAPVGSTTSTPTTPVTAGTSTVAGAYIALTPFRQLDTRDGTGGISTVGPNATVRLKVTGRGGIPTTGVSAVVLNVTVALSQTAGNLTVFAGGGAEPNTSNLNFLPGQTVPNLVVTPVGSDGTVSFKNNSGGTVVLIADSFGYYTGGATTVAGGYTPLAPYRQLDTRNSSSVGAGGTVELAVAGHGGIPASNVSAVAVNVTVALPQEAGNLTVFAGGGIQPNTSNLNFLPGQTVPNLVMAPVSSHGTIALTNNSAGTVQIIVDTFGYVTAGMSTVAGAYIALTPFRQLDTRDGTGGISTVGPNATVRLKVTGRGGIPTTGVSAVVLNVTVALSQTAGNLTVFAGGGAEPNTSNLNFLPGQTVPNLVVTPVGSDGTVSFKNNSGGTVVLIADSFGYYTAAN